MIFQLLNIQRDRLFARLITTFKISLHCITQYKLTLLVGEELERKPTLIRTVDCLQTKEKARKD